LLASRAVVGSARKDEHNFLAHSGEKARLLERISTLEKENKALENLRGSLTSENGLLKGRVSEQEETISKMQEKMSLDESVLENLRGVVEREMPRRLLTFKWRFASSKPMLRERMSRSQSLRRRLRRTA